MLVTSPMRTSSSSIFVSVTGTNHSLSIVSNPLTFIQTPIIPGTALFIDGKDWSLVSAAWSVSGREQRLRLLVRGPADTSSLLYLYSPQFRPHADYPDRIANSITVDNALIDPTNVYDERASTFVLPLRSRNGSVEIIFNFDIPQDSYLYSLAQSVGLLYVLALSPFAIASLYIGVRRSRKT